MKIIRFLHRWDYGHDWYVQFLFTKKWALFQGSISFGHYPGWPFIQIKSGSGTLFSAVFWVYKFGLDIGICERTWNFKLYDTEDGV